VVSDVVRPSVAKAALVVGHDKKEETVMGLNYNSSWHGYRAAYAVFWIAVILGLATLVLLVIYR
jgi:hypothetical protein